MSIFTFLFGTKKKKEAERKLKNFVTPLSQRRNLSSMPSRVSSDEEDEELRRRRNQQIMYDDFLFNNQNIYHQNELPQSNPDRFDGYGGGDGGGAGASGSWDSGSSSDSSSSYDSGSSDSSSSDCGSSDSGSSSSD